jgi:hypothetical protein
VREVETSTTITVVPDLSVEDNLLKASVSLMPTLGLAAGGKCFLHLGAFVVVLVFFSFFTYKGSMQAQGLASCSTVKIQILKFSQTRSKCKTNFKFVSKCLFVS